MHNYEERMRAVELYIKLGKRLGATIHELGYPTKNALKGWFREYELMQDLPIQSAPRSDRLGVLRTGVGRFVSVDDWTACDAATTGPGPHVSAACLSALGRGCDRPLGELPVYPAFHR